MAGNNIPERLVNFRVYDEGRNLMGIATVDLPEIEAMSETTTGAGIAGEVETPTLGHYGSMTTTFSWRTIEKAAMVLSQARAHHVEIRGSQQIYDAALGLQKTVPVRVVMRIIPKTVTLGTFEPGATTDTEQEFEVTFLSVFVDNVSMVTIDKFNFIAIVGGVDALAGVRKDLGI